MTESEDVRVGDKFHNKSCNYDVTVTGPMVKTGFGGEWKGVDEKGNTRRCLLTQTEHWERLPRTSSEERGMVVGEVIKDPKLLRAGMVVRPSWSGCKPQETTLVEREKHGWKTRGEGGSYYVWDEQVMSDNARIFVTFAGWATPPVGEPAKPATFDDQCPSIFGGQRCKLRRGNHLVHESDPPAAAAPKPAPIDWRHTVTVDHNPALVARLCGRQLGVGRYCMRTDEHAHNEKPPFKRHPDCNGPNHHAEWLFCMGCEDLIAKEGKAADEKRKPATSPPSGPPEHRSTGYGAISHSYRHNVQRGANQRGGR